VCVSPAFSKTVTAPFCFRRSTNSTEKITFLCWHTRRGRLNELASAQTHNRSRARSCECTLPRTLWFTHVYILVEIKRENGFCLLSFAYLRASVFFEFRVHSITANVGCADKLFVYRETCASRLCINTVVHVYEKFPDDSVRGRDFSSATSGARLENIPLFFVEYALLTVINRLVRIVSIHVHVRYKYNIITICVMYVLFGFEKTYNVI